MENSQNWVVDTCIQMIEDQLIMSANESTKEEQHKQGQVVLNYPEKIL